MGPDVKMSDGGTFRTQRLANKTSNMAATPSSGALVLVEKPAPTEDIDPTVRTSCLFFTACSFVLHVASYFEFPSYVVAVEGYRLVFDNELPIEVRNANQDAVDSVGMLETMRIKVFIMVRRVSLLLIDIHASFIPWAALRINLA